LCGTVVNADTSLLCDGNNLETLPSGCHITVAAGKKLTAKECRVEVTNSFFAITGELGARLKLEGDHGNGHISATNIFFDFTGMPPSPYGGCVDTPVIEIDSYNLYADGSGPLREGNIAAHVGGACGTVYVHTASDGDEGNMTASWSISMISAQGRVVGKNDPDAGGVLEAKQFIELLAPNKNVMLSGFSIDAPRIHAAGAPHNDGAVLE
jgi:hypothetical protein